VDLRRWSRESLLLVFILLACIPAGLAGLVFDDFIEQNFRSPLLVAFMLVFVGFVMWGAEWWAARRPNDRTPILGITLPQAFTVGVAQAFALIPGTSRSGITISTGLYLGFDREAAARFSFLLSTPIILAAGTFKLRTLVGANIGGGEVLSLAIGFVTSAVVGFMVIGFLLRFLRTNTLVPFVIYRFGAAAVILILYVVRGGP
jgi:undecaprenyl-diphosphatase